MFPPMAPKKPQSRSRTEPRRKPATPVARILTWTAIVAAVFVIGYCASEMSGVAYGESALGVIDFSSLPPAAKRSALKAANAARCTCGCGMTLAQCVATDSTCPVREPNIQRIKTMVHEADRP
jgi:hypothetical protein